MSPSIRSFRSVIWRGTSPLISVVLFQVASRRMPERPYFGWLLMNEANGSASLSGKSSLRLHNDACRPVKQSLTLSRASSRSSTHALS